MKKIFSVPLGTVLLLAGIYAVGPRLECQDLEVSWPEVPVTIAEVEGYVARQEAAFPVKKDNEAKVVWADSAACPTEYVLLYLHGFTASSYEGCPMTLDFVARYGANAYLPRLYGHGLKDPNPLLDMTPDALYRSAREALAVAHKLGHKVVVMATSTGCTLALMLAADFPQLVDGLILYSPNIKIRNPFAPLLSGPWGLQISRAVHGGAFAVDDEEESEFWYSRYRVEAQVYLQHLLDMRMHASEFAKVHQPLFLGYYYRDREHQDPTVDVSAALRMFDEVATPDDRKVKVAFPDAGAHVIIKTRALEDVRKTTFDFAEKQLGLKPVALQ